MISPHRIIWTINYSFWEWRLEIIRISCHTIIWTINYSFWEWRLEIIMISCRTIIWTINYSQTLYKLWTIVMKVEEATYILLLFIFLYIFMSGVSWSIGPSSNVILIVDNFNSIKKIINNIDLYNHILYLSEHVQRSLSLHCRAMWTPYSLLL